MNVCSGVMNKEPRLVGMLNNSVIGGGGSSGDPTSLLIEDTLLRSKWIEITGENKFVYQYSNPKLNNTYFIQVNPELSKEDQAKLEASQISQNIFMDSEVSKTVYNIYAESRPVIDIKVSILATNIKKG